MSKELKKVIESSTFVVHDGEWIYAKVGGQPKLDDCFMLSRDQDEITAVFKSEGRDKFEIIKENKDLRKLIELKVSVPFYAVGFLAAVSKAVAEQGSNILIVSTYSKDYILVNSNEISKTKQTLVNLGFEEA